MGRMTTIERTGRVPASVEEVRALMSSTDGYTAINPYRTADPGLRISPFGPAEGVGSGFAFTGKDGKGTQTVSAVKPSSVVYAIDMGAMGTSTQTVDIRPLDAATSEVTWSMTMDAGNNPLLRLFALLANRIVGPALETGLGNLARHPWHA